MQDVDEADNDNEPEEDDNEEDQDDAEGEDGTEEARDSSVKVEDAPAADGSQSTGAATATRATASPSAQSVKVPESYSRLFPPVRPEAVTARLYDIIPTMAAPQATSVNALAVTPDLRYWMTGGSDGYIRKYDGPGTINGKQLLTVAQRHPFVDSVVKAGVLMSYWENEEPGHPNPRGNEEHVLSPVYSLAVHSQALWLLSGLESGGINLQSVRHDEGKRIACLQQHTNAVSVLALAQDEKSVISGSWDKNILDWDLNTGDVKRKFEGSGGQISAIELRPVNGAPIPSEASEMFVKTETFSSTNGRPPLNGTLSNQNEQNNVPAAESAGAAVEPQASPAHESLFGGSDTGSLFGETAGGGFGGDEDDEFSRAMNMGLHDTSGQDGGMDHSADMAMADSFNAENAPPPAVQSTEKNSPEAARAQSQPEQSAPAPPSNGPAVTGDADAAGTSQPPPAAPSEPDGPAASFSAQPAPDSPSLIFNSEPPAPALDPTQSADTIFFSADINGTIRIWDRRVQNPVARIGTGFGVPPWCQGACWSPDGNWIYAGRRNGTVEEYSIHKARSSWEPERALKFPAGSGPVTAVRSMPNGRHLIW